MIDELLFYQQHAWPKKGPGREEPPRMPAEPMNSNGGQREVYTLQRYLYLKALGVLSPPGNDWRLCEAGDHAKEQARQALSSAAYHHIEWVRRFYVGRVYPQNLPPRSKVLITGIAGLEMKAMLVKFFQEGLGLPFAFVDAARLAAGGITPAVALNELVAAAGGNYKMAEIGVICFDDFGRLTETCRMGPSGGPRSDLAKLVEGWTWLLQLSKDPLDAIFRPAMSSQNILFVFNR